jgi:hypothetical protein
MLCTFANTKRGTYQEESESNYSIVKSPSQRKSSLRNLFCKIQILLLWLLTLFRSGLGEVIGRHRHRDSLL